MKRKFKTGKWIFGMASMVIARLMLDAQVAFASVAGSKGVTGTVALLDDIGSAFLIIDPAAVVVWLIIDLFKLKHADPDSGEAPKIKKHMNLLVIGGVAVFLVSGLFKIVLSYYK